MANGRPWTDDETRQLRELAANMPAAQVAQHLGRSTQAVRQRASLWAIPLIGHRWGPRKRST